DQTPPLTALLFILKIRQACAKISRQNLLTVTYITNIVMQQCCNSCNSKNYGGETCLILMLSLQVKTSGLPSLAKNEPIPAGLVLKRGASSLSRVLLETSPSGSTTAPTATWLYVSQPYSFPRPPQPTDSYGPLRCSPSPFWFVPSEGLFGAILVTE